MKCPNDRETLVMTERNGVEIDYCPKCRGVWLDRGELDKIIERTPGSPAPSGGGYQHYDERRGKPDKKKKESFLSELFDF